MVQCTDFPVLKSLTSLGVPFPVPWDAEDPGLFEDTRDVLRRWSSWPGARVGASVFHGEASRC